MKDFPLPVRVTGPGSQPADDEELQYLAMPREMNTFRMPMVPERADATALAGARDAMTAFLALLLRWDAAGAEAGPRLDMTGVPAPTLEIVNQVLGEGEVSIHVGGARAFRIQESVFTGVWRVCAVDGNGRLTADWLEAAPLPGVAIDAANEAASPRLPSVEVPPGAMNSPALIAEIAGQMASRRRGDPAHVINLTLFPLTPDDHRVLEAALPVGPVAIISRGFGNCRITSTGARDVWRVQYFNNMNTLILDTIEIVDVPEVALAAAEDLADSRERLAELLDWMDDSVADEAAE
ncbi:MAG: hydrogenase expression/formation protein [Betaproteobacteria bacterium]